MGSPRYRPIFRGEGRSRAPPCPTDKSATRTRSPVQVWLAAPEKLPKNRQFFYVLTNRKSTKNHWLHFQGTLSTRFPLFRRLKLSLTFGTVPRRSKTAKNDPFGYIWLHLATLIKRIRIIENILNESYGAKYNSSNVVSINNAKTTFSIDASLSRKLTHISCASLLCSYSKAESRR